MFELFAIVKKIIDAGDNFSTRETTLTMVRPLRLPWAGNHLPQLWTSTGEIEECSRAEIAIGVPWTTAASFSEQHERQAQLTRQLAPRNDRVRRRTDRR